MSFTAPTQRLVKDVAALKQKKHRLETGQLLVEGPHPIEEALKAGLTLRHLFIREGAAHPASQVPDILCHTVDETAMHRMATTDSPPTCLAVFEAPRPQTRWSADTQLVLALDGLQDPGNLGTLIRSAVAFGWQAVALLHDSAEPFNPKVIRASAGLVFALPVLNMATEDFVKTVSSPDWTRYLASAHHPQARSYREADFRGACVLVLGNEGQGIRPEFQQALDGIPLTIPMAERVESLNVAVSGSILMAEAAAQRNQAHDRTAIL